MRNVGSLPAASSPFAILHSSLGIRARSRQRASLGERRVRFAALALAVALLAGHALPARAGVLPYSPALARVYDAILDARFDDVDAEIARACPPAPVQACDLLRVTALWWRIQLDPFDTSRDAQFRTSIDAVVAAMERWTTREPKRADAWFFLGGAYGLRVQFRVLRLERLAAARDGKRIKDALERSLALEPNLQDAWFGIGLYHYYADIAPAALKVLRWMLFLPGGNKVEGLREMLRARNRGELLRGEADFQLQVIYLWYERNHDEALRLLEGLKSAYPHNPQFPQAIAEVQDVYRHDRPASLDAWRGLFDLARQKRVAFPEMSEARGRMGMAAELDALAETDSAIEQLRALTESKPTTPYGIAALAQLRLGAAYDRMGWRDQALAAYRAATAAAPPDDPDNVRGQARDAQRHQPDARAAEAFRLSIEGLRHLQRRELTQAAAELSRSLSLNPTDAYTIHRQALLLLARDRSKDALAEFERLVTMRPAPPPTVLASSCYEAARLLEESGMRDRSIEMYLRASRVRGAEAGVRQAALNALERLRVPTAR
jgi:tetratricopeptide (TPR) repeat protein